MRKIRVAQIGIAHDHATAIFNTLKKLPDLFEIAGYALPENEKELYAPRLAELEGYSELTVEEIMADPSIEAVTIETEEQYLTKYALLAAEHGKQIHVDKPCGDDFSAFEKLIGMVKEKNLVFHVGYMYRYNPALQELFARIEAGELGEIFNVEAQMNGISPPTPEKRRWLNNIKGGMMFFLGCHMVDLVLRVLGEPKKIIPHNKCTGISGVTVNDYGMAVFEYDKAMALVKSCAQEYGGFPRRQLVVCGTKGTAEIKPLEVHAGGDNHVTEVTYYMDPKWGHRGDHSVTGIYDRYEAMMTAFAEMAAGERKNPFDYDYELLLCRCLMKASGMM